MTDLNSKEFVFDTSKEGIKEKEKLFGKYKKSIAHRIFESIDKKKIVPQQYVVKFDNKYSLSTICNEISYGGRHGLWEIMVMKYDDPVCVEGITDQDTVVGNLTTEQAIEIHEKVSKLPR